MRTLKMIFVLSLCAFVLPKTSLAINLGKIFEIGKDTVDVVQTFNIDDRKEAQYGASIHPYLLRKMGGRYPSSALNNYVNRVGQKLARLSSRRNMRYTFTVVNSKDINAFALPGGYIYITKGLLSLMKDESELAAVLGHEIGHVVKKHGVKKMRQSLLAQKGFKHASGKLGSQVSEDLALIFYKAAASGYGRRQELESDRIGIVLSNKAGYDPYGAVRVFNIFLKMEAGQRRSITNKFFASHPQSKKRISLANGQIQQLSRKGKVKGRTTYARMTRGL